MSASTSTRATSASEAGGDAASVAVRLDGVTKRFGAVVAVDHVDLEVLEGEFLTMLGPSGSGKTTMLRMIAGFELPTDGAHRALHGDDVTDWPPFDRDVNTVFQDYALFPHMTVAKNVEYGLQGQEGRPKAERQAARRRGARSRPPRLASRPAGRASCRAVSANVWRWPVRSSTGPRVLLLDEPLAALDRKLREEMQVELKQIQERVGITFVLVTHDQGEALTMSDRIAVFNEGRVEQVGDAG